MPTRPGRIGTKSCFSPVRVLKTRRGKRSTIKDGFEISLDIVFVDALGQRKLLDEEIARRVEHLPLAEAEVLVELEQVQIAKNFGDFKDGAGLDLLHVLPVPGVHGEDQDRNVLLLQDLVNFTELGRA